MIILGVDDFFWTVYFCEDAYFRPEDPIDEHLQDKGDGPSAGVRMSIFPLWDPRYYFLSILVIRIDQIKMEWEVLIEHISTYLEKDVFIFPRCLFEDARYPKSNSASRMICFSKKTQA